MTIAYESNAIYPRNRHRFRPTVKIAILDENHQILFSDYKRHFANIQETLSDLLKDAYTKLGNITLHPMITGSGGLTLANYLQVLLCRRLSLYRHPAGAGTDVAIELGGGRQDYLFRKWKC